MEDVQRDLVKWRKQAKKGGTLKSRCDMCETRLGRQLHEIVNRGRTPKDSKARQASFATEITSLLCDKCHIADGRAHTPDGRKFLLMKNIRLYGLPDVQFRLDKVNQHLTIPLDIEIPMFDPEWFWKEQLYYYLEAQEGEITTAQIKKDLGITDEIFQRAFKALVQEMQIDTSAIAISQEVDSL